MNQWRISSENAASLGYRSRYHAFLEQKPPKSSTLGLRRIRSFGKGLLHVAIFFAMLLAILTLVGMALSWYHQTSRSSVESQKPTPVQIQGASTPATLAATPPTRTTREKGKIRIKKKPRK